MGSLYRVTQKNGKNLPFQQFWQLVGRLLPRQVGWRNIPNLSQEELFTILLCYPVFYPRCVDRDQKGVSRRHPVCLSVGRSVGRSSLQLLRFE